MTKVLILMLIHNISLKLFSLYSVILNDFHV